FDSAKHVGGSTTLGFPIPPRHPSRLHPHRGPQAPMQHHTLLAHAPHRPLSRQRLFRPRQHVFHAPDVLLIQYPHAPHFFPATASGRGFPATSAPSPGLPVVPACASPLLPPANAPSTAPAPPAADHTPEPQCVAVADHPTAPLSPAGRARTRPVPNRPADSAGWSATPSSASTQRWPPPGGWPAPPPVAAAPRLAAPSAPAATRSAITPAIPAVPAWTSEPEILFVPCPRSKLESAPCPVPICITRYVVTVLVSHQLESVARRRCFQVASLKSPAVGTDGCWPSFSSCSWSAGVFGCGTPDFWKNSPIKTALSRRSGKTGPKARSCASQRNLFRW